MLLLLGFRQGKQGRVLGHELGHLLEEQPQAVAGTEHAALGMGDSVPGQLLGRLGVLQGDPELPQVVLQVVGTFIAFRHH